MATLEDAQPSRDEVRRILDARARVAARPPATADDVARVEVLAFSLAEETYAVETRFVREVCQLKDVTAVPCVPPFIAGVMNLRGRVLAIVDLRKLFDLPSRGLTELNRVIVLQDGDAEFGLLADAIDGLRSVATKELHDGLRTLTGVRDRFLKGITPQMLVVLDGGRLLSDAGLRVDESAAR
jgi:purine-binding chemotaxis protein CheW